MTVTARREIARLGGLTAQRKAPLTPDRARAMGRQGGRPRLRTVEELWTTGSPGDRRMARDIARSLGVDADAVLGRPTR